MGTESFDRAAESLGKAKERTTLPIEEKESFRWLTGYRLAYRLAAACPAAKIVRVADREADIYDIFVPCTAVFDDSEWKSAWRVVAKKPLPNKPPTLSTFMQLLTQLGGYNNRASEMPSGPQPLWVGLRRMTDFATAWLAFGPK